MKRIRLSQDKFALVDDEDFERVSKYNWFYHIQGYATRNQSKLGTGLRVSLMHRFIMKCPSNKFVDHIDGNRLNNQKSNLRICTNAENTRNGKMSKNNTSGYKGVTWSRDKNKWVAQIMYNRKHIHGGYYASKIDAAKVHDELAKEYFGKFANLNFPDGA